jgi:hypothetical protein
MEHQNNMDLVFSTFFKYITYVFQYISNTKYDILISF